MSDKFFLLTALALCHGFNLDTENPMIFQESAKGFGQSVVQFQGSRVVVGAPQEITAPNQIGTLYQCDYSLGKCRPISLQVPSEAVNMSLGLSLAAITSPFQLLACGPTVHQICKENTYLNGFCFMFGPDLLRPPQRFPETLRACPQQESDIAFLIDGSGSINSNDFQRMKEFVYTVMDQFKNSKSLFSLMQYSDRFRTHFTFKDFQNNPNPVSLVTPIIQLEGLTYTATGIRKVINELFQRRKGARKDALKIMVVITDGEKYRDPLEYEDVIPQADKEGVIRYVIGVGDAFQNNKSRKELYTIASEPAFEHVFQVDNFAALKTIQNQLQEKIFAIEGTQTGSSSSSFEYEMSQEGFSAAVTSNGLLLGAVGSFDWAGGAFLRTVGDKATFINTTRVDSNMNDAYLGYAAEVILRNRVQSLVLGAPRYQHTGLVVMFKQDAGTWKTSADVKGSQIGSYFGASLCSVDVDRNDNTDLILIGAPHYYEQTWGGQVYVCPLPQGRAKWQCQAVLRGEQGHPWGRFGASLTVLGDMNGDKLTDVAIGAPGEQENQGAVYVFHGTSALGISPSHSQRIEGSQLASKLQYFGQSMSGGQDITMDGLLDLAVGAQGHMLLLRSQPILRVEVTMVFTPREVPRNVFDCHEQVTRNQMAGEVRVCFRLRKITRDRLREGEIQSTITYDLALDPGLSNPRAFFDETKNATRRRIHTLVGMSENCETLKLLSPNCVKNSVTPIILRFNFSLVGSPSRSFGNLRPVLAVDAQRSFTGTFPFEKNCGNDNICEDDLSITFSFMNLGTLVVGGTRDLNVSVTVRNGGEDSYSTKVTFFHPSGLSYRRMSAAQHLQRPWRLNCNSAPSPEGPRSLQSSSCDISHPIFPGNSEVTFNITFDVDAAASLGRKLLLKANVTSENNMPVTSKTEFWQELPVKYAVYLSVSSLETSTKYLNFTPSEKTSQVMEHQYQFRNLGYRSPSIYVVFLVPILLNQKTVLDNVVVSFVPNVSNSCSEEKVLPPHTDFLAEIKKTSVVNCSVAVCKRIQCTIFSFGSQEDFTATLKGNLSFDWYIKTSNNYLQVVSTAEMLFDESVFSLSSAHQAFTSTQTKVEQYEIHNPLPLIVGSSIGGLLLLALITVGLYKLGFFKRQYKDMMNEAAPQAEAEAAPPQ